MASGNDNIIRLFNGQSGVFMNDFISGGLNFPVQFIFGSDTNIYACSFSGGVVQRYNGSTGAFIDTFVAAGNGLSGPNFLTFRPAGTGPLDRDGDGMTDIDEILAGTWPGNNADYFHVTDFSPDTLLSFRAVTNRLYTVQVADALSGTWSNVPSLVDFPGTGGIHSVEGVEVGAPVRNFRVRVAVP